MTETTPSALHAPSLGTSPEERSAGLAAALLRRWPTALGIAFVVLLSALAAVLPEGVTNGSAALTSAALIYLVWSVVRSELVALQVAGMVLFGGVALVALFADPPLGTYLVAAGWLVHAGWDVYHHRTNKAVARWYAEACGVTDVLIAAGLVLTVLL